MMFAARFLQEPGQSGPDSDYRTRRCCVSNFTRVPPRFRATRNKHVSHVVPLLSTSLVITAITLTSRFSMRLSSSDGAGALDVAWIRNLAEELDSLSRAHARARSLSLDSSIWPTVGAGEYRATGSPQCFNSQYLRQEETLEFQSTRTSYLR